jgi:hypothetical protein
VRRHKVWTAIIVVTALAVLGSFTNPDTKKAASTTTQVLLSPSPSAAAVSSVPAPVATTAPPTLAAAAVTVAPRPTPHRTTAAPTVRVTTAPAATKSKAPVVALSCVASVSNAHPTQYSTVYVYVTVGRPSIDVHAVAHYKSTDTAHDAVTASDGKATLPFKISRATKGFTVVVDVSVSGGPSCQTAFTPQ